MAQGGSRFDGSQISDFEPGTRVEFAWQDAGTKTSPPRSWRRVT
jgi:hypothetical protein